MRVIFLFVFITTCVFTFQSCDKKDSEKPVITSFRIENMSNEGVVEAGNKITVETGFQDSRGLGKYELKVEGVFDGSSTFKSNLFNAFSFSESFTTLYRENLDFRVLDIPSNTTSGLYIATAKVFDEEGNAGDIAIFHLFIINNSTPTVEVLRPDTFDVLPIFTAGDYVEFIGSLSDNDGMTEVKVSVFKENDTPVHEQILNFDTLPITFFNLANLPDSVFIPENAAPGKYRLNVSGKDIYGNYGILRYFLNVRN